MSPFVTDASSGLTVAATATSPSSAGIYVDNIATSPLTSVGVTTYDGFVAITSAAGSLSFDNGDSELSETGNALVAFLNRDDKDGSGDNVVVSGTVYASAVSAGIGSDGTNGAGQILVESRDLSTETDNNVTVVDNTTTTTVAFSGGVTFAGNTITNTSTQRWSGFQNGDVITISGASNSTNDGNFTIQNIAGNTLTLATAGNIAGDGGTVLLSAGSGIGTPGTGNSLGITGVATLDAMTNTGGIYIDATGTLTLDASTSGGDINVSSTGDIDLSNEASSMAGIVLDSISATGTVTLDAGGAIVDEYDSLVYANTLALTATDGIGTASNPLETSSPTALTLTASAGDGLFLDNNTALAVNSATAGDGDLSISTTGSLTLLGRVSASCTTTTTSTPTDAIAALGQTTVTPVIMEPYITVGAELLIDAGKSNQETVTVTAVTANTFTAIFAQTHQDSFSISAGNVTLTATDGALTTGNITTSAAAITKSGAVTVTPAVMEPYITIGAQLLIDAGNSSAKETVTVTAVTANTFTALFANTHAAGFAIGPAPTTGNPISADSVAAISAGSLAIAAEQIGSTSDVIQTSATAINATANYGGIYVSNNDNGGTLTLTAAAVGTSGGTTANNIDVYNAGNIVLRQQTTALTQLATSVPIAVFNPGGKLTLLAGETLSADGSTLTSLNSSATITSATPAATARSTVDTTTGDPAFGEVTGVSGLVGSSGYTTAPTVTFSGGGGSGASATATITNGVVTGITLTGNGTGYTSAPTVTVSPPGDDIYTGTYTINGTFSDNFSGSGGLNSNWTVRSGSFTVANQTATATGTGTNLATVSTGANSANESVSAKISGTLMSGQSAGLVALFTPTGNGDTYYYGPSPPPRTARAARTRRPSTASSMAARRCWLSLPLSPARSAMRGFNSMW